MSVLPDGNRTEAPATRIGPGRLILVVGPSGAGKDTLIAGARTRCAGDASVIFPRRVITRVATASEEHDTVSDAAFRQTAAAGGFALWWEAHGLCYGIPAAIDAAIRARKALVCNVSRTIAAPARQRYASVTVVHVTAPPEVLQARLSARERSSDGSLADRMARSAVASRDHHVDIVIDNVGAPEIGIRRLLEIIRSG
jgi:ribose 1,5-bisphosphokinase